MTEYICPACRAVDGVPVRNLSVRHTERGAQGRFVPRKSTQVGALGPAGGIGPGGADSVSGRQLPGVARHDVLFRDPLDWERVTHVAPDYSGGAAISAQLDDGTTYPLHLRRA